jgi:hypothetical protein
MFRISGCPLWRVESFFCSLEVLHGSLRIKVLAFLIDKIKKNLNEFFPNLAIINLELDPDPDLPKAWIWMWNQ